MDESFSSRATEKASGALYTLATGTGSLTERLINAWVYDLSSLDCDQLPGDLQDRYYLMYGMVTTHGPENPSESQIHASIRKMNQDDASDLARLMVSFALDLAIASE